MNQMEILRRLDTIIPEITRTKDPEGVMLKYASKENFAPAQLEKLGHVFNAAKTLAFMDKSANRGGSFSLVDVPEMVGKFTSPSVKKASASRTTLQSQEITKSASAVKEFDRVPNFMTLHLKQDIIIKEASAPVDEVALRKQASIVKAASEREKAMLQEILGEADESFNKLMDKMAMELHQRDIKFSKVESDMIDLYGEVGVKAASACSSFLTKKRFKHDRASDSRKPSRLPYDSTGLAEIMKEASDVMLFKEATVKYAAEVLDEPIVKSPEGFQAEDQKAKLQKHNEEPKREPEESPQAEPDSAPRTDRVGTTAGRAAASIPSKKRKEEDSPVKSIVDAIREGMRDRHTRNSEKPTDRSMGLDALPLHGGKQLIDSFGSSKNHTQMKVDEAHDDAKFSTTLQRLLITDPIISEHDPDDVASLASSIRAVAPDGARDPNYLRFALREALQYGALPSHTYKDMADAQNKIDSSRKSRDDQSNARYTLNA